MRLASVLASVALHVGLLLVMLFWPAPTPIRLDAPPVLISLVEGPPGGNRTPSPILGPQGTPGEKIAPSMPAPPKPEAALSVPDTAAPVTPPREESKKPEPKPLPKPEPKPEPDAIPLAEKKKPEAKPEPKQEKPHKEEKKPEPPKPEQAQEPKKDTKPVDPVQEALRQARSASSRENIPQRGSAVERALSEARRKSGGHGGGGGGEGDGVGGGGLGDVYIGQVMLAVRPNWGYADASRANYICTVRVRVDASGKVQSATLGRGSGNASFDASAVNAVVRTGASGQFPPPPSPQYYDLELMFSREDMLRR